MHSSRMRTARLLTVSRSIPWGVPRGGIPLGYRPPPPFLWKEGMTHACENITLPQTSFAGDHYIISWMDLITRTYF